MLVSSAVWSVVSGVVGQWCSVVNGQLTGFGGQSRGLLSLRLTQRSLAASTNTRTAGVNPFRPQRLHTHPPTRGLGQKLPRTKIPPEKSFPGQKLPGHKNNINYPGQNLDENSPGQKLLRQNLPRTKVPLDENSPGEKLPRTKASPDKNSSDI